MQMQREYIGDRRPRRTIASYPEYGSAQRAVDFLADRRFPVERTAIVAEGLKLVEQVTGRMNYGRAALAGALSGAVTGAFVGFLIGLFTFVAPLLAALNLAFWGLLIGAAVGAAFGLLGHGMTRGQRDFSSVGRVSADRYNIMVDAEVADDAERQLLELQHSEGGRI